MKRFDRRKKKREKNLGMIIMIFFGYSPYPTSNRTDLR